ncbi:EamA family transporter [Phenylobacterium sp.]|jgi:drug/metabolite transporter (DMT)-like permease|uniref:EamA family transporter n=1 Tax=Phenylobacterium sp. TaxID=1871053 RepID=UPI002F3EBA6A
MLWIFLTAAAGPLQVARNALQRGLVDDAGPWGATLVRFLFGLPFSLAIFAVVALLTPGAHPDFQARFWLWASVGALAQVGAAAALLVAMRRAGFAVATAMQQSSLPLAAVFGLLLFGDRLSPAAWAGVAAATLGVAVLSWPRSAAATGAFAGGLLGALSGGAFAIALNAYRQSGLALEPAHPIYAGTAGVCVAQALQSLTLLLALAATRPRALAAVAASWRQSLGAGFFGSAASACWFAALAQAPAAMVRAVGVIEIPFAALAGARLFRERLTLAQALGALLAAAGVAATALG